MRANNNIPSGLAIAVLVAYTRIHHYCYFAPKPAGVKTASRRGVFRGVTLETGALLYRFKPV